MALVRKVVLISVLCILQLLAVPAPDMAARLQRYFVKESTVVFLSEAPLERIKAVSHELKGVLDPDTRSLAFSVVNRSFKGFNSTLQREHFNESYMESDKYPQCTFTGKIVDEVNFYGEGTFQVRVKGILTVKGVGREQIIKGSLQIEGDEIRIRCNFPIALADHQIRVPKLVYQKIAPEVLITVDARLSDKETP
jgi:hypothetical protein